MAKVGDKHRCEGTDEFNTIIQVMLKKGTRPLAGEWRMVEMYRSDDDDWLLFDCGPINYCPWCGVKLEETQCGSTRA